VITAAETDLPKSASEELSTFRRFGSEVSDYAARAGYCVDFGQGSRPNECAKLGKSVDFVDRKSLLGRK